MAGVRFTELQSRPMEFLDLVDLTMTLFAKFRVNGNQDQLLSLLD